MIPHFMLRQNNGEFLIIRMGDEFHIIDCNEALTREKRLAILESGCTPEQMQEMGLSGTTIPKSDIQALTVTGCGFQDDVIFYLGKRKKLAFWFPQAYEQRKVDDFFRGIPRRMVKSRRRLKGGRDLDWRAREQDPQKLPVLHRIGILWNVLCFLSIAGMLLTKRALFALWFWVILALIAAAVYLNRVYDLYFAFYWWKGDSSKLGKGKASHIGYGMMLLVMVGVLRSPYVILDYGGLILPVVITGLLIWLGLFVLCRECREDIAGWLLTIFLVAFFCGGVLVPHINHTLAPDTQTQTVSVIGKSKSTTRGRTNYVVTVRLPDGEDCLLTVSPQDYDRITHGDKMELQVGSGFFGIAYAIDE